MNQLFRTTTICYALLVCFFSFAGSFDSGGGVSTSGSYQVTANLDMIGGIGNAGSETNRTGYIGQLTEVISSSVTGIPSQVNENATNQLSGVATMDDATLTMLIGTDVTWSIPSFPIASISSNGVATMSAVYQNTAGTFSGTYLGVLGSGSLLVLDTIPDNYGTYASDGLRDSWQVQYFGFDNPNAAPGKDVTGTGQNNLFKYIAGLDPTNAASVFRLRIEPVAGEPNRKNLIFHPRWNDRTYTPLFRTNLVSGAWMTLTNTNVADNSTQRTITDLDATDSSKFYRIQITLP